MQHRALLPIVRETLRYKICRNCVQRPAGSESLGPREARSCEPDCPIFRYMNELVGIAATARNQRPLPADQMISDHICDHCTISPTAGDYCTRRLTCSCPLTLYGLQVIDAIEPLLIQHAMSRRSDPVLVSKKM